ncbi:TetR/AcrR family transcriptional regulator [Actinomadura macrotermitis]|uniref:HTH tetR-type domain-containing protein n=1 Tax=Actinomadura macrotermitis TaxID=2585200 RepID=A0A7K0BXR4_9ACTN|nr:TetR/AcrR family transcriptional regulator [Actinomadura macrotermitis]MQY05876.1 hypothetical protein [Actinomadura macrotermitis]
MTSEDRVPAPLRRLWRIPEASRLGRPATLDVDLVVATAVAAADGEGLDGVTLPKIGKRLGVTGMSLYRHIGSKDELLTLMADHALGAPPGLDAADWREGLRAWARALRAVFRRRPWMTHLPISGPPSGPNQIAWMEAALAAMAPTRLGWAHKLGALSLISGYVTQSVRQEDELARGRADGQGQADAERDYGRALMRLVDPARFPETARLFSSPLFEAPPSDTPDSAIADADFSLGLDLVLDGIACQVERS